MAKRNDPERLKKGFLVETTLGNCIVTEDSKTLVSIVNDCFLEKDVQELHEGDMVVYHKQGIDKTLEEIEPFLNQSARYEEARNRIHADDEEGRRIPIFRHDLVPIAAELAGISRQVVDVNLFKPNSADFNASEYSDMVEAVHLMLGESGCQHRYADATVHGWLTGETLAPRDWTVFNALTRYSNPFTRYNLPKENGGLHDHYTIYVVVRQGIMRYLTTKGSRKNTEEGEGEEKPEKPRISLAQEINIVLSQFMEDVSDEYALARVVKIRKLDPVSREMAARRYPRLKLTRRVVTNESAEDYGRKMSYSEILQDFYGLHHIMHVAMGRYVLKNPDEPFRNALIKIYPYTAKRPLLVGGVGMNLLYKYDGCNTPGLQTMAPEASSLNERETIQDTYFKMIDGTIDSALGLEPGQFYRCFKATLNLNRNVPKEILEYRMERSSAVNDKFRQSLKDENVESWTDEEKKTAIRLQKKYGIQLYPVEVIKSTLSSFFFNVEAVAFDLDHLDNTEFMQEMGRRLDGVAKYKPSVFTKADYQKVFEKYGVAYMMDLVSPNEFLWGNLQTLNPTR